MFDDLYKLSNEFIDSQILGKQKEKNSNVENVCSPEERRNFLKGLEDVSFIPLVTHLPKFSHPSAKACGIGIVDKKELSPLETSLLSSLSEMELERDTQSNAKNMKLIKFLTNRYEGSVCFMNLLAQGKEQGLLDYLVSEFVGFAEDKANSIINNLKQQFVLSEDKKLADLGYLKQVYFPCFSIDDELNYKNVVLFYASSLHVALTKKVSQKIIEVRGESKENKTKGIKEAGAVSSFCKHFGTIKVGGAQPQNISFLASSVHGDLTMLSCCPKNEYVISDENMVTLLGYLDYKFSNFFKNCLKKEFKGLKGLLQYAYERPVSEVKNKLNQNICDLVSEFIEYLRVLNFTPNFWLSFEEEPEKAFKNVYEYLLNQNFSQENFKITHDFLSSLITNGLEKTDFQVSDVHKDYLDKGIELALRRFEE